VVKLAWKNSLEHQIKAENLPSFEVIKNDLETLFNKDFGNVIINEEIEKTNDTGISNIGINKYPL